MALHRTFYLTYILIYWWSSGRGERIAQCPVGKMCSWWSLSFVSLWFQCLYWKVSWSWRYWCHWMQWRTEEQPWIFWIGWPWLTAQTGHMNVRWIRVQLDFLLADCSNPERFYDCDWVGSSLRACCCACGRSSPQSDFIPSQTLETLETVYEC